jgi:hypothetical protein
MMAQQLSHETEDRVHNAPVSNSSIEGKIQELTRSVSEVYKYELLTTNQYLKQMELVLKIFQELSESITYQ